MLSEKVDPQVEKTTFAQKKCVCAKFCTGGSHNNGDIWSKEFENGPFKILDKKPYVKNASSSVKRAQQSHPEKIMISTIFGPGDDMIHFVMAKCWQNMTDHDFQ